MNKEHQTNEVGRKFIKKLIEKHKNDDSPWVPTANTDIGVSYEFYYRKLLDSLKEGKYHHSQTVTWGRDEICSALTVVEDVLRLLVSRQHGWYCMYCGWLHFQEVTSDERCCKCFAVLPHVTATGDWRKPG